MFRNSWSKLASRIACLAVLMSAALWLSAPARANTDCIISQNTKTGAVELLTCGTSGGNFIWECDGGGGCSSDPSTDSLANMACDRVARDGCPTTNFYEN